MKSTSVTLIGFIIIIFSACSKEYMFKRSSVWVEDSEYPGLPTYSEWGYNTFGVYYERQTFTSNDGDVPLKVIVTNNNTQLLFDGDFGTVNSYDRIDMKVFITFPNETYANVFELIQLDGQSRDLTTSGVIVEIEKDGIKSLANVIGGKIVFQKVKNLYVDQTLTEVILAGTFDFQILENGIPYTYAVGRFDFGVNEYNFFNF